jgi:hypothetical protein
LKDAKIQVAEFNPITVMEKANDSSKTDELFQKLNGRLVVCFFFFQCLASPVAISHQRYPHERFHTDALLLLQRLA